MRLTDDDMVRIYAAITEPGNGGSRGITDADKRVYLAGMKREAERALFDAECIIASIKQDLGL